MRAMILAAGRGARMRELTNHIPKPLIKVKDKYLIEYAIANLQQAGIKEVVINISYHGEQIKSTLGNGERYGMKFYYSEEPERLETGGGIFQALSLLGDDPFIVISSDIITDFSLASFPHEPKGLAHLLMVENPSWHAKGDFGLNEDKVCLNVTPTFTFANIGIYRKELFSECTPGYFRLASLLIPAIEKQQITGEKYNGHWYNIGTPEDLTDIYHQYFDLQINPACI